MAERKSLGSLSDYSVFSGNILDKGYRVFGRLIIINNINII